jgi:hypothetical protein
MKIEWGSQIRITLCNPTNWVENVSEPNWN